MPHHKTLMKQWQLEKRLVLDQLRQIRHRPNAPLFQRDPVPNAEGEEKVEKDERERSCASKKGKIVKDGPLVPFSLLLQVCYGGVNYFRDLIFSCSFITRKLDYCNSLLYFVPNSDLIKLQRIQNPCRYPS